MGDLIQFIPRGTRNRGHCEFPVDSTPTEVLTEFLREAKEDQFVFLSVAVYRKDGSYAHVELGLASEPEDPPEDCA